MIMKLGSARWIAATVVALIVAAGSAACSAQNCPTSPSYSPDFPNQNCLMFNGNASLQGSVLQTNQAAAGQERVCLVHRSAARGQFLFQHLHVPVDWRELRPPMALRL